MTTPRLVRTFFDLDDLNMDDAENVALMRRYGFGNESDWANLLKSRLILLLAEAQSGKTFECQAQQREMWEAGEPAFYVELASVAAQPWSQLRSEADDERLERWRRTNSETATIFLDSVDELQLTQGSFATALRNVANDLRGFMARVRVVLTARPLPVDKDLFERTFAIPPAPPQLGEADFAAVALNRHGQQKPDNAPHEKRYVSLLPLSTEDVAAIAARRNVVDTRAFLEGLQKSSMLEFMRRPQDVIEAAAAWLEMDGSFGTHAQQVAFDIRARLRANPERNDRPLSDDRALEGAQRIALAAVLTQRLTIRHDVNRDRSDPSTVVDPATILHQWGDPDRKALLERGLFGFASYGRVRFHNRLAFEFLAASRLDALIAKGLSRKAVRRLLVVETAQGFEVVRPTLREVAAWLSLLQPWVFDLVLSLDPSILMNMGDPGSLTMARRGRVLSAFIDAYGKGSWRGLSVPPIQIHRVADGSLGPIVRKEFDAVENPEVQRTLLALIGHAKLEDCVQIPRRIFWATDADRQVRAIALDALIALDDQELAIIAETTAGNTARFDHPFSRIVLYRLFPRYLSVGQLLRMLSWLSETGSTGSELSRVLPGYVDQLDSSAVLDLLANLPPLVEEGRRFDVSLHTVVNDRPHLVRFLAAVCARLIRESALPASGFPSVVLAARLARDTRFDEKMAPMLADAIASASSAERAAIFAADVELVRRLRPAKRRFDLLSEFIWTATVQVQANDRAWVRSFLVDPASSPHLAAAALLVEMHRLAPASTDRLEYLQSLRPLVSHDSCLLDHLDKYLQPASATYEHRRWEICDQRRTRQRQRRETKAEASWIGFWRELRTDPAAAFDADRSNDTAWNLYRVMRTGSGASRSSGWNRRLIEEHLGTDVANRLRSALLPIWRRETPLILPERSPGTRDQFWEIWGLALAAISAEAEDADWVAKLTHEEVEQAVRYATLERSGYPAWLADLAAVHPDVVGRVVGREVAWSLTRPLTPDGYSMILQDVETAVPAVARLVIPRVMAWLNANEGLPTADEDRDRSARRMGQAITIVMQFGSKEDLASLRAIAASVAAATTDEAFLQVWLPVLFRLDPEGAVTRLEALCTGIPTGRTSSAVRWVATLFSKSHFGRGVRIDPETIGPDGIIRLLRLAYAHVTVDQDAEHEGSYEPDLRDDAEDGRNALLRALLDLEGPAGWSAKQLIASDPMFAHLRDRLQTLAREKAAREADRLAMLPRDVVKLDTNDEPGPRTSSEMSALLNDRIEDLRDELLKDHSQRELWASTKSERLMRRAIAAHLATDARGAYTVSQEGVTADEKETDIRLLSTATSIEGVIELKVGDSSSYSGASLRKTIKEQLLNKYLAPAERRAGMLLITRASRDGWDDPDSGDRIDFGGLITMLKAEAERIEQGFPDEIHIRAEGLDLKPRLGTEVAKIEVDRPAYRPVASRP